MKYLFVILSIFFSQSLWAAEESSDKSEEVQAVKPNSAENRVGKKFMVAGEVIGQGPSGAYGQGLNLGYFLTDHSMLVLELNGGHTSIGDGFLFSFDGQTNKTGYSVGINYKHFVANSFYFKTGLDARRLEYEYIDKDWLAGGHTTRKFTGESAAASFSIGNQWQFSGFTVGCDWFGVELPLSTRVYDVEYSANAGSNERSNNRDDIVRYVTGVGFTLTRLYLGASF